MARVLIILALLFTLPSTALAYEIHLDADEYCDVCECIDAFDGCVAWSPSGDYVSIGNTNGCIEDSWVAWCTPLFCAPPATADNIKIAVVPLNGTGFYYLDILGPDCEWVNIMRAFNGPAIQSREIDVSEFGDCAFTWRVRTDAGNAQVIVDYVSITWDCV